MAEAIDPQDTKFSDLDDTLAEAPPSYSETPRTLIGDGNIFTHSPPMEMLYAPTDTQPYVPRSERLTWTFGFFDCFRDPGAALKACCCPAVSYGQTRHRLHSPNTKPPIFSTPCLGYCLAACCLPGSESIFGLLNRNDIRRRLEIDQPEPENSTHISSQDNMNGGQKLFERLPQAAGFIDDTLRHVFCGCCALVQEDREIRSWEARCQGGNGAMPIRLGDEEQGHMEVRPLLGAETVQ